MSFFKKIIYSKMAYIYMKEFSMGTPYCYPRMGTVILAIGLRYKGLGFRVKLLH